MKKPKNAQIKLPELFRLSKEVWNSLTFDEIISTADAMREMELFQPPYNRFDVECDPALFATFGKKDQYPDEDCDIPFITKVVCHYDLHGLNKRPEDFHITFYGSTKPYMLTTHPWTVAEESREIYRDLYLFVFTSLIVVLASRNIVKNQVTNDARARNHTQRTDSKHYSSTTTIRVGKITEYIGNKSEGSGRTVRAHLRRGHIKGVRHGEGRTELKKVFIPPTFVNADRDWVAPKRGSYKVVLDGKAVGL